MPRTSSSVLHGVKPDLPKSMTEAQKNANFCKLEECFNMLHLPIKPFTLIRVLV